MRMLNGLSVVLILPHGRSALIIYRLLVVLLSVPPVFILVLLCLNLSRVIMLFSLNLLSLGIRILKIYLYICGMKRDWFEILCKIFISFAMIISIVVTLIYFILLIFDKI